MRYCLFFLIAALPFILSPLNAAEPQGIPPIRAVYFVPADTKPLPNREERLGRVMKYVQDFYRKGMQQNGYGNKTFALEWDKPGALKLYTVKGKKKQSEYGRNDAGVVRNEVREAMKTQYDIDINRELIIIFQILLKWEGNKAIELGPYVGGGSPLSGTAWVYDDALLDAALLSSTRPGGYYVNPCSIGKFNTHYVGGIAHELGHAFSLPHDCETNQERRTKGHSLMGGGNHTFGQELRREGRGTFLSPASALRLTKVRAFAGNLPDARTSPSWTLQELKAVQTKSGQYRITGKVEAVPSLTGIIAYNDNQNIESDYDAKTFIGKVTAEGKFNIEVSELENVPYQLRLTGIHDNGLTSQIKADYTVKNCRADLSSIDAAVSNDQLLRWFRSRNVQAIETFADQLSFDGPLRKRCLLLIRLLSAPKIVNVAALPSDVHQVDLSFAEFTETKTGWGPFLRAQVYEFVFIQVGGTFFDSGLFVHAPSVCKLELQGKWKTFDFFYGVQQDFGGTVRFIVKGDGKELFRSKDVKDGPALHQKVDVSGVQTLELITESAVQGNSGAWSIWCRPVLLR